MIKNLQIARYSVVDVKVGCGKVYRYKPLQPIANDKVAADIEIGETLPDLKLPDVIAPCACPVIEIRPR